MPPVPARVVDENGSLLHRQRHQRRAAGLPAQRADGVRLRVRARRLPRPRLTADYLRRSSDLVRESYGGALDAAVRRTVEDMRTNRYDEGSDTLTFSALQADAFRELVRRTTRASSRSRPRSRAAAGRDHGSDPAAAADGVLRLRRRGQRPRTGRHDYSYTNNWPSEPRVANTPTANVIVWSVLSLVALLGGIGLLGAFGRWGRNLGWHGREQATLLPCAG